MLRDFPLTGGLAALAPSSVAPPAAPVAIRHAATVMLVRPDPVDGGVQVFTFRRVRALTFAAGMLVFPGGAVEEQDRDATTPWAGPPPSAFAAALSADEDLARALVVAAARETFEECGVLLAGPADGSPDLTTGSAADWEGRRQALLAGQVSFGQLLRQAGLRLRADLLRPWAHWLTPRGEPRRFDTRFFVAALPPGQEALDLGGEGERASWLAPAEAVEEHRQGRLPMLPPTLVALEELAAAGSVDQLLGARRRPRPVSPWVAHAGTAADGTPRYVLRIDLDGVGGGEPGPDGSA